MVDKWASPQQNGFLPKRSILLNAVGLEEAAMRAHLAEEDPAMFLMDMDSAFPLVDHRSLGMPAGALNFIDLLYHDNARKIKLRETEGQPFPITSGIR